MSFYNESYKFEGIRRYDGAGNPICFYKGFEERYKREIRDLLSLKKKIDKDLSMKNNKDRKKRGGTIAPNLSKKMENGEVEL